MDRREWLKVLGGFGAGMCGTIVAGEWIHNPYVEQYGATRPSRVRRDRRHFHRVFRPFKGVSQAIDQNVFLFQNLQKEIGEIIPHIQIDQVIDGVQVAGEGDCVGQATAMGCDVLAATGIHLLGQNEVFKAKASVEMAYAGSRIEIGRDGDPEGNPDKINWLKGRGGSHGEWAARFVREYGVLHRLQYADGGNSIDLRGYNPERSRKYRDEGVPDWLEPIAREHPVKDITNVLTGQEALDAVCAGQPVIMCSSYAFPDTREADGFTTPHLGMGWIRGWGMVRLKQWFHAMILTGAILEGPKIGGIIQNSHGAWNSGPRPYDMPEGSFGVELQYLDMMVKDWFDCYALANYRGHEAAAIRHKLYLR